MKLTILESVTYYCLRFISFLTSIFPRRMSIFFGMVIGNLIRVFIPIRKKVAIQNLQIAFPEKTKNEIDNILKKCYQHFGIVLFDLLRSKSYNNQNIDKIVYFDEVDIQKFQILNCGIIITGHIGSWEMFLPLFGLKQIPFSVVAQFQRNKGAQKFFIDLREFHGSKIVLKGTSGKELMSEIQNNKFLGLASDQNAGKKGIMVPFFNKKTSVPKGGAVFHLKAKSPLLFCYCVADSNYKYKMIVNELNIDEINPENKVEEICKLISLDLEKIVRKYPEQYFWFHRKWPKKIYKKL